MAGQRLSRYERVAIEVRVARGDTDEEIAVRLGRHRSTIWREITATAGANRDRYRAAEGQTRADREAQRPKTTKLAAYPGADPFGAYPTPRRRQPHRGRSLGR